MQIIQSQAAFEKKKQHALAEDGANNMMCQAESQNRRLEANAQAEIEEALTPPVTTLGHGQIFWDAAAAQKKAEAIRSDAETAKAMSLKFAQARADVYRQIEKARLADLDQVVANLQGQMEEPVIADGVRLMPEGTNLYVRNYALGKALPEAGSDGNEPGKTLTGDKAKARVIDAIKGQKAKGIKDYFPQGQSARGIEDLQYTREVKGKLLH